MLERRKFFIDGQWTDPDGLRLIEVKSPRNGQIIGCVPAGSIVDIDSAVHAAHSRFESWSATTPSERADYLERIAMSLEAVAPELAHLIAEEVGMPLKLARRIQVDLPIENLRNHAHVLRAFSFSVRVGNSIVSREAVGVVAAITPWNYPLHQIVLKVAAALAAGCTVVLKPSEVTPLNAFALADATLAAGLPPGVFNLVTGEGPEIGKALVGHHLIDKISFTGSTDTGRLIAEGAGRSLKRVTLELGGKSAAVILRDADLEAAVRHTVNSCFLNSGQTCTALTRMLVPVEFIQRAEQIAVERVATFQVGDPFNSKTRLGPLTTRAQLEKVRGFVLSAMSEGATLLAGGIEPPDDVDLNGNFFRPTVFGGVTAEMKIAREEVFGPVLSILPFRNEEEAVHIANDTPYGLAASVWGGAEGSRRVIQKLRAGQIDLNGGAFNINAPFGGFKQSGYGREAGIYGLEDFLEYKSVQTTD